MFTFHRSSLLFVVAIWLAVFVGSGLRVNGRDAVRPGSSEDFCGAPVIRPQGGAVVVPPHNAPLTIPVDISQLAYNPSSLTINVGDTVMWTNNDALPHTATSDTGAWNSGTIGVGNSFSHVFNTPGTFPYHCGFHFFMVATITVVAASPTPTPTATCVPPQNMVSWWRAENNADDYFSVNNGTFADATYAAGKVGQAFNLNGTTAYVNVPDNPNLYPQAGSFTVDAWINTSQTTGFQQIIAHYECSNNCPSGSANSVYDLFLTGDKLEGQIRDSTGADQELTGARVVADGQFHHVALERDIANNQMLLYVDGTVEASAPLVPTGTITNDDGEADPVTIGAIIQNSFSGCGCPIQFFNGRIDEVQYYSRALTAPEIAGIYNAGSTGQCPPSISGSVLYGNAMGAPTPRAVSNVTINGVGSSPVMTTSAGLGANAGTYYLAGFGAGSYNVTPSKVGGVNGVTSFDAALIALHVAGPPNPQLNPTQLMVADVSNNGSVSSFDAGEIAKFVAGPPYAPPGIGLTATWKFVPPNRSYASVSSNITGQDFMGLLYGEVSGNWSNTGARPAGNLKPERAIAVDLPQMESAVGKQIVVPINVYGVAKRDVISYEFDLRFDPSVVRVIGDGAEVKGTASRGLSVATNQSQPDLLRVVVYGAMPIEEDGVLLNLRFTTVGTPGSYSHLTFERMTFNEGQPAVNTIDGKIELF